MIGGQFAIGWPRDSQFGDLIVCGPISEVHVRLLNKLGAVIMVAGLLIVMAGGMTIRRDSTGTWVQVNLVHAVGGGILLCGAVLAVLAVIAAFASGSGASAKADKGGVVDSEANR